MCPSIYKSEEGSNVPKIETEWFDFLRKHLMYASQMDIFYGVENTSLYPRNIPDAPTFQMNARGSAVNNDNHVVIYEKTGKFGFFTGARAWWLFKVRMLSGSSL